MPAELRADAHPEHPIIEIAAAAASGRTIGPRGVPGAMAEHLPPNADRERSTSTVEAPATGEQAAVEAARAAPVVARAPLAAETTPATTTAATATPSTKTAEPSSPKPGAGNGTTACVGAAAAKPAGKQPGPAAERGATQAAKPPADERRTRLAFVSALPSWLVSLLLHMALLFALAMIVEKGNAIKDKVVDLVATDAIGNVANLEESTPTDLPQGAVDADQVDGLPDALVMSAEAHGHDITLINELPAAPGGVGELSNIGLDASPLLDFGKALGGGTGGGLIGTQGFEGRGEAARRALAMERGGTPGSENAVGLALVWLAHHQNPDGSWSFDHRKGPCQGRCANPGRMERGEIAATALALLPFLGAGQTHIEGKYKKNVQAGLYYLINRMKITKDGGDLSYEQGVMYGHGLASIALCEAYGMTKDSGLAQPAQQAINFIVYAQDPNGGGWRYTPHQPGDTSVVGWQLMALKSAHMAYLEVPPKTIKGVVNFLNSVQMDSGSHYGYVKPDRGDATTAIGLLCRMYLGWKHEEPALQRGVSYLSRIGPQERNMYYNYYATQVLHHYDGEEWTKWNEKMRDYLVNSQARANHEQGSWYFDGTDAASQGGRLYTTAMCAMTLEVYYRHLPIYQKGSTASEFDE